MLSKLKAWLFGGIAAVFGLLVIVLKWSEHKREKAVEGKQKAEREVVEQTEIANTQSELNRAQNEARKKAAKHEIPTTSSRPSGDFGDKRLHTEDRD